MAEGQGRPCRRADVPQRHRGKAYKAASEAPPWEKLRDRAAQSHYVRGTIPAGALLLFMGFDCQADRVECQLVAFGRDHRRFVIDYFVIPGHISEKGPARTARPRCCADLAERIGPKIGVDLAAIDGNAWTEDVWDFAKRIRRRKLIMVRGLGADSAPLLARVKKERNQRTGKLLKYAKRFYNFGTSV
jgi:phage terminase large subunit GpA-like protein